MGETILNLLGGLALAALFAYALSLRHRLAVLQTEVAAQRARYNRQTSTLNTRLERQNEQMAFLEERVTERDNLQAEKERLEAELKQLNQEMEYKTALTLTLANAAFDALIVVNEQRQVIAINNSAEFIFDAPDALGKQLAVVTNAPELEMMVDDALTNEEESFEEQMIINQSNYRVQAQVIRRDDHQFIGLAIQDISKLVRLNRARRDMVANISHELRTPIANIRSIIDGLFHEQDRPKRKDSISSLRAIAKETDNLLWLVQEMSDLSMIESGQAIMRLVDVQLNELVEEAVERLVERSEHNEIQMVRHIPEKLHVLCDRDLAQRVLVNLIHNAIKWSPKGEAVTISASNGGDEVTISVLDNGPGVPEEHVDRIFERFYQVDASRSAREGGTGLGLAICRHIVEAHGGRIWAESNKDGGGGRFAFTLLSAGEHAITEEEDYKDNPV